MGYRILYEDVKHRNWFWMLVPLLAAAVVLALKEGGYEEFARYVGAAIRGY